MGAFSCSSYVWLHGVVGVNAVEMTLLPSGREVQRSAHQSAGCVGLSFLRIGIFGFMLLLIIWQATEQPEFAAAH